MNSDKAQVDPHQILQHVMGAKMDGNKARVDLILDGFGLALLSVAEVGTVGAIKYTENGWQQVPNGITRYRAAAGRHRLQRGLEERDAETKLRHLAHEAWNVLAELELTLRAQLGGELAPVGRRRRDNLSDGSQ